MISNMKMSKTPGTIPQEEIRAVAQQIAQKFNPQKIILFGSYAQGNYHPYSDVDLLVILEEDQNGENSEVEVALSVTHKFPMDILVRSSQQLAKRLQMGDTFLRNIIEQGIVLYERSGK
jgi:predicted nucleotidyltransferase